MTYHVIGLMSGTSLDGLDIALCRFQKEEDWSYEIVDASTVRYDENWTSRLSHAESLDAFGFIKLHKEYGRFIGSCVNRFMAGRSGTVDFIASHGHTIFHRPEMLVTCQIGDGASIAAETNITTICDFRGPDVALGGQGAPLVPVGDSLLFNDFDFCLNLGGFANVSYQEGNRRVAFDICPVNIALNHYCREIGKEYDENGQIAGSGKVNYELLNKLNDLSFFHSEPPKSLGKEWLMEQYLPVCDSFQIPLEDKLRTLVENITGQIVKSTSLEGKNSLLVTGGGAYNQFLVRLLKEKSHLRLHVLDHKMIDFKEALIFAFLGVLRMRNETNCLSSVTGARHDNIGGCIYQASR
jgi:anhydro-N-acetylmuramic acid kinase